jgi:DNA-binding HxlR family transcriptional regulator
LRIRLPNPSRNSRTPCIADWEWTVIVVGLPSQGSLRYSQIFKLIDACRSASLTLNGLERDSLSTRTVYLTIPPCADYAVTERGLRET